MTFTRMPPIRIAVNKESPMPGMVLTAAEAVIFRALISTADEQDMPLTHRQVQTLARVAARAAAQPRPGAVPVPLPPRTWSEVARRSVAEQLDLEPDDVAVLLLIADGASNVTIQERAGLTRSQVERRVRRLFTALGGSSRADLATEARKVGLLRAGGAS
jgi:DNA-binding NarL/FixJ family response regulator